jgi:hypothetical protein
VQSQRPNRDEVIEMRYKQEHGQSTVHHVPRNGQSLEDFEMEFDPVSGRMQIKSDKIFSHYGQDLDTATKIPAKPAPKAKPASLTESQRLTPTVSDVQAELRQYKEKRLPDVSSVSLNIEGGSDSVIKGSMKKDGVQTSFSIASAADRAKLEDSFAKIQKELAESWNQISVPGQLRSLHKLSTEVRNLGNALVTMSNQPKEQAPTKTATAQDTSTTPSEVAKVSNPQAQKLKDLASQVEDLGQRLSRMSKTVASGNSGSDIFPMLFGEKAPATEKKSTLPRDDFGLQNDVEKQKEAMRRAEETEKFFDDPRMNDSELSKTIQNLYEKEYGQITASHEQVPLAKAEESESVQPSEPKETAPAPPRLSEQDSVYTVLAYDPSTSEVSTTTLLAPMSANESSMPLTVALTQLSEPAKFLPHLRLMRENNFRAVSVTKNLLVLRGIPPTPPAPEVPLTPKTAAEEPAEAEAAKSLDSANSASTFAPGESGGRSPKRLEPFYSGPRSDTRFGRRAFRRGRFWREMLLFTVKLSMITGAVIYLIGLKDGMKKVPMPKQKAETGQGKEAN